MEELGRESGQPRRIAVRLLTALACGWLLLAASARAQEADDAPSDPAEAAPSAANAPREIKVDQAVDDERIAARLRKILDASGWFEKPAVKVDEGLVTLTGRTVDGDAKDRAGDWARSTEGVVAVFNKIAVEENTTVVDASKRVWGSVRSLTDDALTQSPLIIAGLMVLVLTAVVVRVAQWLFRRAPGSKKLRPSLQDLIEQLVAVGVWIVGVLVAATVVFPGMTPSKLLTVLGLSSVAIGFAFKDIFENFLAGILILWKFPIDRGDFIECEATSPARSSRSPCGTRSSARPTGSS